MSIIAIGRHFTFQPQAAKDILADDADEGGMFGIVIESIAEAQTLEDEAGAFADDFSVAGLTLAEGLFIETGEMIAEGIRKNRGRVEHDGVLRVRMAPEAPGSTG